MNKKFSTFVASLFFWGGWGCFSAINKERGMSSCSFSESKRDLWEILYFFLVCYDFLKMKNNQRKILNCYCFLLIRMKKEHPFEKKKKQKRRGKRNGFPISKLYTRHPPTNHM